MKLIGQGIYLRDLHESDAPLMASLNQRNRDFFEPFVTDRPDEFYTVEYQQRSIRLGRTQMDEDKKYTFGVFAHESEVLIGVLSLTEVERGALQSCWLGYYMDHLQNGRGYTTQAVQLVIQYAFRVLGLHRIEAGVMPHNVASIRVLEKAGFAKEGLSKKNVLIRGRWQDHLHFAIVNPIRKARWDDAPTLTQLALRSKAYWGYDATVMEACREELTIRPEYIESAHVLVFEPDDIVLGFCAFLGDVPRARLDYLYVAPTSMGQGIGRTLWEHAVAQAMQLGYEQFHLDADPHAEDFYLRMGAERVGQVPSGSISGRMLPLLRCVWKETEPDAHS